MKLQFDANQGYQLEAIQSVVDLFDGMPRGTPEFAVIKGGIAGPGFLAGQAQSELGAGNPTLQSVERLRANTRSIQERNDIEIADAAAPLEAWQIPDPVAGSERECPHFSVEMETGTGKTYVYLRTIYQLATTYGFRKFAIVVPSVAIREGVLHSLEVTREHLQALFENLPAESFVYDAKRINLLRQFATSTTLQILVINIDAFRKNFTGTEEEKKSNVIYQEKDQLSGRRPIEFVQAARPIVIIDEPQSVDSTEKAQEAIAALNPLCTLRYSATHRNPYNLIYRLDPVEAFKRRLVKQIVVASATVEGGANAAFVRVESVDYRKGLKARLRIHRRGAEGPREGTVTAKPGDDLHRLSREREQYRTGWEITEISAEPGHEFVVFANGTRLGLGEEHGGMRPDIWREQIRATVRAHLEKELELTGRGLKVLSLFFIDRVANYRDYDPDGHPTAGKFAKELEAALQELLANERYREARWLQNPLAAVHGGYFSADKKGRVKDTTGNTLADDDTYDVIMRDKERLLSLTEPLRFVFSHSALREGWDNPNVFQICTLNETRSTVKKRQEIGRGLRLPVDQTGMRVFDDSVNRLFVMANESYEEFARALQSEYEEDCGVTFGKVPLTALARLSRFEGEAEAPIGRAVAEDLLTALVAASMLDSEGRILPAFDPTQPHFVLDLPESLSDLRVAVIDLLNSYQIERHIQREGQTRVSRLRKEVVLGPEFRALWDRIKPRTTYRVEFETRKLIAQAVDEIRRMEPVVRPTIRITSGALDISRAGVGARATAVRETRIDPSITAVPDLLAYLQGATDLTRSSLVKILTESGRLDELFNDPQRFLDQVTAILNHVLHRLLVDGIRYERIQGSGRGAEWEMRLFQEQELVDYLSSLPVGHSIYDHIVYDSEIEREFARQLDGRSDIRLFVKLPRWFEVDTPLGGYNPDWAILKENGQTLYLARETKGTREFLKLRTSEADKVRCGKRHFEALGVDFDVVVSAQEV